MDEMNPRAVPAAFSLVELLIVVAIILLLAAVSIPAFNSIAVGSNLNRAGQLAGDQIAMARQMAVTRNREVQVRFYQLTNGLTAGWRAMQVWRIEQTANGSSNVAASRVAIFPEGIILDSTRSPLLGADANVTGTVSLPAYGSVSYSGFRFRANGATDASVTVTNNYVTLRQASGASSNYYTVQVNPITGKTTIFRP